MDRFVKRQPGTSSSSTLNTVKRQKLDTFKEIVGASISHAIAQDCMNATNYDLERARNMYYNRISESKEIRLDDEVETSEKRITVSQGICIGTISCHGSTTTKISPSSNELYMGTFLNCTFSIKPLNNAQNHPECPPELVEVLYGSPIIRFSLPNGSSEIGRVPAPIAAALCPLVRLGFADVSLSVGFPGCAGLSLNPGSSVPLRIDIAITDDAMKRMTTNSSDDLLVEKINNFGYSFFLELRIVVRFLSDVFIFSKERVRNSPLA